MIMFSFIESSHREKVFLPDKHLFLTCVYSDQVKKHFLCTAFVNPGAKSIRVRLLKHGLSPILTNYTALPYKRQSSVDDSLVESILRSQIEAFGFPCIYDDDNYDYLNLKKMKNFYLNFKKHYVVVACRKNGNEEKVAFLFNSYSRSAYVTRYFRNKAVKDLVGDDFQTLNSWYPYVWVEYMGHPICLFSDIVSHSGHYSLGPSWSYYLLCFLRDGFIPKENLSSVFGFVYRDRFSQIIECGR